MVNTQTKKIESETIIGGCSELTLKSDFLFQKDFDYSQISFSLILGNKMSNMANFDIYSEKQSVYFRLWEVIILDGWITHFDQSTQDTKLFTGFSKDEKKICLATKSEIYNNRIDFISQETASTVQKLEISFDHLSVNYSAIESEAATYPSNCESILRSGFCLKCLYGHTWDSFSNSCVQCSQFFSIYGDSCLSNFESMNNELSSDKVFFRVGAPLGKANQLWGFASNLEVVDSSFEDGFLKSQILEQAVNPVSLYSFSFTVEPIAMRKIKANDTNTSILKIEYLTNNNEKVSKNAIPIIHIQNQITYLSYFIILDNSATSFANILFELSNFLDFFHDFPDLFQEPEIKFLNLEEKDFRALLFTDPEKVLSVNNICDKSQLKYLTFLGPFLTKCEEKKLNQFILYANSRFAVDCKKGCAECDNLFFCKKCVEGYYMAGNGTRCLKCAEACKDCGKHAFDCQKQDNTDPTNNSDGNVESNESKIGSIKDTQNNTRNNGTGSLSDSNTIQESQDNKQEDQPNSDSEAPIDPEVQKNIEEELEKKRIEEQNLLIAQFSSKYSNSKNFNRYIIQKNFLLILNKLKTL